ncbi:hypothetical protein STSP2_03261 [Anaerohalosphaera lusitana]|uniref:Uncharacterized protein n=1 Tax=Anaerohalosphaera lusitana TaxID=1936003 RepID=A0A1U9NQ74_9BACT|nr:hypothetical protein [Anaerohalosphaera lusitana]AQT70059.1 hypothetical protein STSP2_03261 [Anaerohalosphaera lusitana]
MGKKNDFKHGDKEMKNVILIIAVVLIVLTAIVGIPKMRSYWSVGRENLVNTIDNALGEFRVKRAESSEGIQGLEKTVRKLKEGQIRCEVQAERLVTKLNDLTQKRDKAVHSLKRLRELISEGEPAVLGGREYSVTELQEMAEDLMRTHESIKAQMDSITDARDLLEKNAYSLKEKAGHAKRTVSSMHAQLEEIDAKIVSLDTMRKAAMIAGGKDETLATNFDSVKKQLDQLYVEVEIGLRMEQADWKASSTAEANIDEIFIETQDADETLERIDDVLGMNTEVTQQ